MFLFSFFALKQNFGRFCRCSYAVLSFLALKLVFQACLLLIEWFKLYLAQNNYFAVLLLNYADISLEKGFRPFTANHVFFTHISLTRSFVLLCCLITPFSAFSHWKKGFACLQLITLIVAISHSQQNFCLFAAKLHSFQPYHTKILFCALFFGFFGCLHVTD